MTAQADPPARALTIWLVNQYAGSPVHGMEYRHFELARELGAIGHRVVIISGSNSHLFLHPPTTSGTYSLDDVMGVTYCWVSVPRYHKAMSIRRVVNMLVFAARLYRLPADQLPRPDAIVVSSPSLFPIMPAERWARLLGARLVFEVRDLWPLTIRELAGLSSYHPLIVMMSWFEKRAYRVSDAIVSVLPATASHLAAHGVAPEKLSVIPNGIGSDALLAPPTEAPPQVQAAVGRHSFTVGFAGTLGSANALDTLIGAARRLAEDDIGFVLVGHGPEDARLRAMARDLHHVALVGPVPRDQVPATLRCFDVCYVGYHKSPLYRFGISPNKLFEYMAAGRPIIQAASAANDPVRDAACGLSVPADDPGALATAIRAMRAMSQLERARLGANGRAFVEREHTYASLARQYVPVLEGASR